MTSVLVAGATGTLGSRSVKWCRSNLPEVHCLPCSRTAVSTADSVLLNIHDTAQLAQTLMNFDVFVNAVGPYDYDPTNIIKACNESRCHYTDLAELPEYLEKVRKVSVQLESSEIAIIPGCSTTPGLVNTLSNYFSNISNIDSLEVWLSIGTKNPTSPGLVFSLLRPMGRELPGNEFSFSKIHHNNGRLYGRYPFASVSDLGNGFSSEAEVKFFVGFDSNLAVRVLAATSLLWKGLNDSSLRAVSTVLSLAGNIFRPFGGEEGVLELSAKNRSGTILSHLEVVVDRDGLSVPCQPPLWIVAEHERQGGLSPGFFGLEDVITSESAVRWLCKSGCQVRLDNRNLC